MAHRTGGDTGATFDAVFEAGKFRYTCRKFSGLYVFSVFYMAPIAGQVIIKAVHIDHQITKRFEALKGCQGDGVARQILDFSNAGQALNVIDSAGTGAAGRMMAGAAVHQRVILFEANFFKTVQNAGD